MTVWNPMLRTTYHRVTLSEFQKIGSCIIRM